MINSSKNNLYYQLLIFRAFTSLKLTRLFFPHEFSKYVAKNKDIKSLHHSYVSVIWSFSIFNFLLEHINIYRLIWEINQKYVSKWENRSIISKNCSIPPKRPPVKKGGYIVVIEEYLLWLYPIITTILLLFIT